MTAEIYLKNARVVTEEEIFVGGVVIADEKIVEVVHGNRPAAAATEIDLDGKILMPGVVDGHVHFNEPGREEWEGYYTGTMAAAAGGTTTILEMPLNSTPPTINRKELARKRAVVESQAVIDYAQWGGFVNNNLADLADLHADGVIGFKAFASNSGVDFARVDDDMLYAGLVEMAALGNLIGLHAENEYVTDYLGGKMREAGRTDRASWHESRPPSTELEAVQRACYWAKVTGGNLHIVHVSIADGIKTIAEFKRNGANVTSETCPHYLFFDHSDFERIGPAAKCAPPIRSKEDKEALWDCVRTGLVDIIGSDHSPCTWAEKEKGMDNIWKAWGGISGVQTMLPVMISEGIHKRGLSWMALVKMLCGNPARRFGLYPQKGGIWPGADADLVVIDPDRQWTLTSDQLFYKNKHSAYVGYSFKGAVENTFVRGQKVYQDGKILVKPGSGKLQRRTTDQAILSSAFPFSEK